MLSQRRPSVYKPIFKPYVRSCPIGQLSDISAKAIVVARTNCRWRMLWLGPEDGDDGWLRHSRSLRIGTGGQGAEERQKWSRYSPVFGNG